MDPNPVTSVNPELQPDQKKEETATDKKKRYLNIATWNIRRGLVTRENELTHLLLTEEIDVIFLTETDAKKQNAKDYHISGYTTYVQLCGETDQSVRIMALTKDNCGVNFSIRTELMAETFPSIWLEIHDKHKSKTLLGGFYRQWTNDGIRSVPNQVEEMEEFCRQINEACTPNCKMITTGDANLCAQKWKLADFDKKSIANPLLECLEQNGLQINNVGLTYQADHASASGDVAHSALDHVYSTEQSRSQFRSEKSQTVRLIIYQL